MQVCEAYAIFSCVQALEAHNIEKDIAAFIKKYFDGKYEPTWHCIVGQSFGAMRTNHLLISLCSM